MNQVKSQVTLNTGAVMPAVGLGLYLMKDPDQCRAAVQAALDAGYRHFDSAQFYENEAELGAAIRRSQVPRDQVFLTTKIQNQNQAVDKLEPSFEQSLAKLGYDYWDLLLLHFPVTGLRQEAWPILERLHDSGTARAIGVSNYTIRHLQELLAVCRIKPAVNQVELHVFLQQPELLGFCREQGIVVQAYSPLAHGQGIDHPVLAEVGRKHGKTPAQIMIRWCLEVGTVPLPKSVTPDRIRTNFQVFDFTLDAHDLEQLAALDHGLRTAWDPSDVA